MKAEQLWNPIFLWNTTQRKKDPKGSALQATNSAKVAPEELFWLENQIWIIE